MPAGRPTKYKPEYCDVTYIYALCCPDSGIVRYVGKANKPHARYKQHLRDRFRSSSPKDAWLQSLVSHNKEPDIRILAASSDWEKDERLYIEKHKDTVFNIASGGVPKWFKKHQSVAGHWHRKVVMRCREMAKDAEPAIARSLCNLAEELTDRRSQARRFGVEHLYEQALKETFQSAFTGYSK